MKSTISKVCLPLGGRSIIHYVCDVARHWAEDNVYMVLSPAAKGQMPQDLCAYHPVIQEEPLGTGHAFMLAFHAALAKDPNFLSKDVIVLMGDTPLLQASDLTPLVERLHCTPFPDMVIMGMRPPRPDAYGRLVIKDGDCLLRIVEAKNASALEQAISLCHTGFMVLRAEKIYSLLSKLSPDTLSKEIYLTQLVEHVQYASVVEGPWQVALGVNTQDELAQAERLLQERFRMHILQEGGLLLSPEHTFLSYDTRVAPGAIIYPFTFFGPQVVIQEGAVIHSFSVLSQCHIGAKAVVGPFAHIRSYSTLEKEAKVGNFVEIKNTFLGQYSQAKHMSYLGDAVIGRGANIGAAVVTCNYDGHQKHSTTIGHDAFIGAHTSLIAPLDIGQEATIGAGSVICKNVPPKNLALSRSKQKMISLPSHSKHLCRKKKYADCIESSA